MKRSNLITISVLLLILCVLGVFAYQSLQKANDDTADSAVAQALNNGGTTANFTDFEGNPTDFDQHTNSIIVAHAWASWVPSSPQSLKDLATIQAEYQDKNVVVLAINRGEPIDIAKQFLSYYQIDNLTLIADSGDQYFTAVEGRTMPETVFYDINGDVVMHQRGTMTSTQLREQIEAAIAASQSQ